MNGNSNAEKRAAAQSVTVKKQSEISKFGRSILADDARDAGGKVKNDIIIPGIKRLLYDIVNNFASHIFLGGRAGSNSKPGSINIGGNTIISSSYWNPPTTQPKATRPSAQASFDLESVIFMDISKAQLVLSQMKDTLVRYPTVDVQDFYDFVNKINKEEGVPPIVVPFTANHFGWRNLADASIAPRGGGYCILFPKMEPLG